MDSFKNKLLFNKEIYFKESIEEGIKKFSIYLNCNLKENTNYFIINVSSNEDELIDEFKNFILFNTISKFC